MKAKNVAKSIDVIIGGLEDLKKELLEADVETTEEAVEAEAPKTRKTSKKSEPVSDNKVSKKTKATTKAAKVEEEDEDDGDTDYASMKYNDLKKLGKTLGVKCTGTREEIVERILNTPVEAGADEVEPSEDAGEEKSDLPVGSVPNGVSMEEFLNNEESNKEE